MRLTGSAGAGWLALGTLAISSRATLTKQHETGSTEEHPRLAVLASNYNQGTGIEHVPMRCSLSEKTSHDVDLVLFGVLQRGEEPSHREIGPEVLGNAHRCFARVRTLYHRIDEEEIKLHAAAPSSPSSENSDTSETLFRAFLDDHVHSQLSDYDALAVFPSLWGEQDKDITDIAAGGIPVAALCDEAIAAPALQEQDLSTGCSDQSNIWVKTLIGVERGETGSKNLRGGQRSGSRRRGVSQSTSALGKGGTFGAGTTIYNNNDPEFMGCIRVASERRQQQTGEFQEFDEALWRALEHPLYGKYASKFATVEFKKSLAKGDGGATTATDVRRLTHKRGKRSRKTTATDQEPVYTKWMTDEKWKHSEKYKTLEKWRGDEENGVEPKWRTEEKWKGDDEDRLDPSCLAGCTHTHRDGTRGRVCDTSCEHGFPYWALGCSAEGGKYGPSCRQCFNDITKALEHDTRDGRAIMCDTMAPASLYSFSNLNLADGG